MNDNSQSAFNNHDLSALGQKQRPRTGKPKAEDNIFMRGKGAGYSSSPRNITPTYGSNANANEDNEDNDDE